MSGSRDVNEKDLAEIETLPFEMRVEVLSRLDPAALSAMSAVSTTFRKSISDQLWKQKLALHFPFVKHKEGKTYLEEFIKAYKNDYGCFAPDVVPEIRKLFSIIKENDTARFLAIKVTDKELNYFDRYGLNIIDWALRVRNQDALDYIYSLKSQCYRGEDGKLNVKTIDEVGMTILHWAARFNQPVEEMERLIALGADINARAAYETSLLHIAAKGGCLGLVQYLVEKKSADVDARTSYAETALCLAARSKENKVAQYLMGKNATVNRRPGTLDTSPLYVAARQDNFELVKMLMEKQADINCTATILIGGKPYTPLAWAAKNGNEEMLRYLVENSPAVAVKENDLLNALRFALEQDNLKIARYLIQNIEQYGHRVILIHIPSDILLRAAKKGRLTLVKYLVEEENMDVNDESYTFSPLYLAAEKGHLDVTKYLLGKNADFHGRMNSAAPLDVAKEKGHDEIVKVIEDAIKERCKQRLVAYVEKAKQVEVEKKGGDEDKLKSSFGMKRDSYRRFFDFENDTPAGEHKIAAAEAVLEIVKTSSGKVDLSSLDERHKQALQKANDGELLRIMSDLESIKPVEEPKEAPKKKS